MSGSPPNARYGHSAILTGSRVLYFGGRGPKNECFRDLHALDPNTMTWYQGPDGSGSPSGRYGHSANLVDNKKMFVFGGRDIDKFYGDL